jgi:DNA-binding transcriptional MerR regulator
MVSRIGKEFVNRRRERVASLRARGLTIDEITQTLAAEWLSPGKPNPSHLVNPKTGKPFDRATIGRDLKFLDDEARERAREHIDLHRARQLQEIREGRRSAWARKELKMVAKFLEMEMKLLGTPMPERKEHRWDDSQLERMQTMTDEELMRMLAGVSNA